MSSVPGPHYIIVDILDKAQLGVCDSQWWEGQLVHLSHSLSYWWTGIPKELLCQQALLGGNRYATNCVLE